MCHFRVNHFTKLEVVWSSIVEFTANKHFLATMTAERYEPVFALRCRFVFLSCAVMASDTDDTAVTKFTKENAEQTGLSRVEKKKETDTPLLQIKK